MSKGHESTRWCVEHSLLLLGFVSLMPALVLLLSVSASAGPADLTREQLIEALERVIATGEPHHGTHDEGDLLQRALDRSLQQSDFELEEVATRASALVLGTVMRPVVASDQTPPLRVGARVAFKLPHPITYSADIFGSLDGEQPVFLGRVESGQESFNLGQSLPLSARWPGPHHVRLQARIVFHDSDTARAPDPEWRNLQELVYAVYDGTVDRAGDARLFIYSPRYVSAQRFDRRLPDMPFEYWLNTVITSRGSEPLDDLYWSSHFCTERTQEPGMAPRRLDLCAVLHFQIGYTVWQLWIRTGRIAFTADAVHWLATPPAFEAFRLVQGGTTESLDLSELERLLDAPADERPAAPDASIAPEDVVITPVPGKPNTVTVTATFRNKGQTNLYGAYIEIIAGDFAEPTTIRRFLRDIPRRGSVAIEAEVVVPKGYGMALFQITPSLSDYSPWIFPPDDPQGDDLLAYRFIRPERAPPKEMASVKAWLCNASKCRGY